MTTHSFIQPTPTLSALKGIGFSDNEAAVYIACLELGAASIWDIAKKSGIKRPTCYVLLDQLTVKGLANTSYDGRRTLYTVASPDELNRSAQRRLRYFQETLPQLSAMASRSPRKPGIRIYEGEAGIQEVYGLTLNQNPGSEILIYGTVNVEAAYGAFIHDYIRERIRHQIRVRAILPDVPANRAVSPRDDMELRQTRFLPEDTYPQTTEVNIYGSTILYIAHSEKRPFATLIESDALAKEEKARFELIWKIAGKPDK